ncbi:MAG: tripartite tricarboxylate transporter substrate binding protein [Xanthobacteraceae bacterium]|nr:tripartite tricarboxylate transporter substrate binding protein [Xanthobacteraceae bacterium]
MFAQIDAASAQSYPTRPVRVIVTSTAGGPLDVFTRLITSKMEEELKQPFVVEARGGAGGNLAVVAAKQAEPDGYTILSSIDTTFTVNESLFKHVPFDSESDFVPISVLAKFGQALAVPMNSPAKSVDGLKALSLQKDINYGSAGIGSPSHLSFAYLQAVTGIKATHVPYRGNPPALLALINGETESSMVISTSLLPLAREGKVRMLAYSDSSRSQVIPDVPTVAEQGYKDFQLVFSYVLLVRAGTPKHVIDVLLPAAMRAANAPDVRDRLKAVDTVPIALSPSDSREWLRASRERWKQVITKLDIRAN